MKLRQLLCLLVGIALLCTSFMSCTKKEAKAEDLSGTIVVLHHRTDIEAKFDEYAKRFNEKYPNIVVEFEAVTDYAETIRTRMSTKEYGDVLMMVTTPPIPSDFELFYEPLGTTEELFAKYDFLKSNAQCYYDGKVYGLPVNANVTGILYNKEVFKKAGITKMPTSSDEFYAMLEQIKANTDAAPIYMNYPSQWTLTAWEGGRPSYAGDPDYVNKLVHQDAPFVPGNPHYELYKVMYEVVKRGLAEPDLLTSDWERSKQLFAEGKIATMNLGSWAIGQFRDVAAASGIDPECVGYMPYPVSHNGKMYAEASLDYNLAVNKYSKNKAAAKAWAFWFADESGYAQDTLGIPALKGSKFPAVLDAFSAAGVEYISANPAPAGEEGLFDKLSNESEIAFWTAPQLIRIVDAAMGTTNESYDDIMNDWNARWAKARKSLEVNP